MVLTGEPGCVLVVDDDRGVVETCSQAIQSLPLTIVSAPDGNQALAAARSASFRLLLIELKLPDIPGLDVVRTLQAEGLEAPFIVMSACATVPVAVEAMALGALNVLEKPLHLDDLRAAVARAIEATAVARHVKRQTSRITSPRRGRGPVTILPSLAKPQTPVERWCDFVMALIAADHDLKTNAAWAKHLAVSLSVLREACRLVHVAPHDARDFARMLRAIRRSERVWKPEMHLSFAEARTLKKLETRSGFDGGHNARVPTLEEFFERQRWIPSDNPALLTIRTRMTTTRALMTVPRRLTRGVATAIGRSQAAS